MKVTCHRNVGVWVFLALAIVYGLMLHTAASCLAEEKELLVDPLTSTENWQIGGRRIYYTLGKSSLTPSSEQTRNGGTTSVKLTYDFEEPRRNYVSAYHIGGPIPGRCEEVSFWLYGNASNCRLRLSIEDARGRWFEKDVGTIDWEGWKQVRTSISDGADWRPLLRRGEERLPVLHPINLRQIAILRRNDSEAVDAVYLHELTARTDVVPADFVEAKLSTGREANLFYVTETPALNVELANAGREAVEGKLVGLVTDFFGKSTVVDLGHVALRPGDTARRELRYPTGSLGTYSVCVTLRTGDRERVWFGRFAVSCPAPRRPADAKALFGCCGNLRGFGKEELPTVLRLNRDAGIRWARFTFSWQAINPAPGVWVWDEPKHIDGPVGKAIQLQGEQVFRLPHSRTLDCTDAVTIAFWARGTGPNDNWQTPLQKWGRSDQRNYGAYFGRSNGHFCFSASYANFPGRKHVDHNSGFSAWDNQWHHYAATYSRGNKKVVLYVDGKVELSEGHDGGELRTNQDDLVIGSHCPASLDEMVLYRRALDPAEVASLAQKGPPPTEGLIAWWSFDDVGSVLKDNSANHLDVIPDEPLAPRTARLGLENGIKTLGILGFPARWASTAPEDAMRSRVYKPKLDAWAEYVENVTRHYRDIVQHWEIWNEPNILTFWMPEPDPEEFIDVVKAGYEAAKKGNPECTVIMPGLAGPGQNKSGMPFLDELLELGAAKYCDAISIHPYRQATPEESDLVGDLQHIAEMAEKHGASRKLWFTENCWITPIPRGSTEHRQALMLSRCYVLSLATGLMERLIWFRLHDPGTDRFYLEHNCGMCYHDLTPKPAYFAHRTVAMLLEGATAEGAWDVGPRAMARCFRTKTERIAAIWSPEGKTPVSLFIGRPTVSTVDIMGNEKSIPTVDGVFLLEADGAVVFLRGLSNEAESRGALLAVSAPPLIRGQRGKLTAQVRNPWGKAERASLSLKAAPSILLRPGTTEVEIPPRSVRELDFELAARADTPVGWHTVTAELNSAGRRFGQEARVAVRAARSDAGPVAHWKLDEGQGTEIGDSSGHGNHGTVEEPTWVTGKHGNALQFDARHAAVIPDSPSLNLPDEVTVAFWLKVLGETGTWQSPVTKFHGDIRRNYGIYLSRDTLCPYFSASHEHASFRHTDTGTAFAVNDGQWHHIAATYSMFDKRIRIYVDGKQEADRAFDGGAMLLTTGPVRIGTGTIGVIDEVLIYPRALSPDEIADLAK